MNSERALLKAIDLLGGVTEMSRKLGCTHPAICQWKLKDTGPRDTLDRVGPKYAYKIEILTQGKIKAKWLSRESLKLT